MAWVYLDDGFPDHPKVATAGGPAAWLFVCGLAYARRHDTKGWIPKAVVARLTDAKQPVKLAKALVDVVLWEDQGDRYYIHDYHEWNKPTEARSAAGRKAAMARWAKDVGSANGQQDDAKGNAIASESHEPSVEIADASGCPPPRPRPLVDSSLHRQTSDGAKPDDDDERFSLALDAIVDDLEAEVTAAGKPPTHPDAWRRKVRTDVETRYGLILAETLARPENATGDIRRLADTARQTCDRPVGAPERSVWPSPAGHWETDADGNATEFVVDPAEPVTNGAPFTLEPFGAS